MKNWPILFALFVLFTHCTLSPPKKQAKPFAGLTALLKKYKPLEAEFSLSDSGNAMKLETDTVLTTTEIGAIFPAGLLDSLNRTDTLFTGMKLSVDSLAYPLYKFPLGNNAWGLLTVVPYTLGGLDGHIFLSLVNAASGDVSCTRVLHQSALIQSHSIGLWELSLSKNKQFSTREKIYFFDGYDCPPEKCPPKYKFGYHLVQSFAIEPFGADSYKIRQISAVRLKE